MTTSPPLYGNYTRDVPSIIPPQQLLTLRAEWDLHTNLNLIHRRSIECIKTFLINARAFRGLLEDDIAGCLEKLAGTRRRLIPPAMDLVRNKLTSLEDTQRDLSKFISLCHDIAEELKTRGPETLTDTAVAVLVGLTAHLREIDWACPSFKPLLASVRDDVMDDVRLQRQKVLDASCVKVSQRAQYNIPGARIRCFAMDPDVSKNSIIYVGTEEGRVLSISLVDGQVRHEFRGHVYPVTCITVTQCKSQRLLITGSVDKTVRLNRLEITQKNMATQANKTDLHSIFAEHKGHITGVAGFPTTGTIFTTSFDRQILSWTYRHGLSEGIAFTANSPIHGICASANRVAVGCRNGEVLLLVVDHKKAYFEHCFAREPTAVEWATMSETDQSRYKGYLNQRRLTWGGHTDAVWSLVEVQSFLFTGSDNGTVIQWDMKSMAKVRSFRHHVDRVSSIVVLKEGLVITSSYDATIVITSVSDGEILHTLRPTFHSITGLIQTTLPHVAGAPKLNLEMPEEIVAPKPAVLPPTNLPLAPAASSQVAPLSSITSADDIGSWGDTNMEEGAASPLPRVSNSAGGVGGTGVTSPERPPSAGQRPPSAQQPARQSVVQLVAVSFDRTVTILDVTTTLGTSTRPSS
eukprot:PhF_6_TR11522/c0_g1_i1/m.18453